MATSDSLAAERDHEVQNILRSVNDLAQVMKDLSVLVIDQVRLPFVVRREWSPRFYVSLPARVEWGATSCRVAAPLPYSPAHLQTHPPCLRLAPSAL